METISTSNLINFFTKLGERFQQPAELYLIGGGALLLLGSPRETLDIDYLYRLEEGLYPDFQSVLEDLSTELKLDLEWVPLQEFIPLPPGAFDRRQEVGRFGQVTVYIFDMYSLALSKIARGFESDLEDVMFLLQKRLIEFDRLDEYFHLILPNVVRTDIIPAEFVEYFETLSRKWRNISRS